MKKLGDNVSNGNFPAKKKKQAEMIF